MDEGLKKILDALPDKPPRSRLESYRDFIEELRRRNRTFREIAEILAEKCQVQVTGSGIHDFLRTRARREKGDPKKSVKTTTRHATRSSDGPLRKVLSGDAVQQKIAALKARSSATKPGPNGFEYDPEEPLRLKRSDQN